MNKKYQPIVISLLIIIGIVIGSNTTQKNKNHEKDKINSILQLINSHYVDSIGKDFEENIINSILKDLDPHTTYIPQKDYQAVKENMLGDFSGIGIEFNIIEDTIVVVSPINGGPSEKLGVLSGDRIIEVDSINIAGIGIENSGVVKRLRGVKGTTVNIKVKRRNIKQIIEFKIIRNTIPLNSVDVSMMITKTTGFLKLNRFSAKTSSEFTKETTKLLEAGMKELILDLRDNPGGYLSAAINICDHFIIDGDPIVYTKGRNREETKIVASNSRLLEDIKLVVLINEGSASASEIISGAVQDNDRGTIIGRRSFGKGLVQEEIKLKDGSAIRLTTQRYYTPSGRSIQKSYGGNINEYYLEQYLRNDSILPDSLKFKTKKGRIVFGGGGINPDIIIEKDTFLDYKTINKIIANGWIREFSMKYTDLNRKNIKKITNRKEYINKIEDIIYNQFLAYINKKDSSFNQNIKDEDMRFIKKQVMANISRNLWGNEDYYRIMIDDDKYVKKGLEIMKTLN
tara:strand:- start:2132 stop:3670 length:1539 start_codon:yes stop_codon:yes gene_type:complete